MLLARPTITTSGDLRIIQGKRGLPEGQARNSIKKKKKEREDEEKLMST